MKGNYRIAEQINEFGIFGEIELDVTALEGRGKRFEIRNSDSCESFLLGVQFGIIYFLEHSPYNNVKIEIINISTMDIDTNNLVVAYVTVMALCNAFNIKLNPMPFFEKQNKSFVFPK